MRTPILGYHKVGPVAEFGRRLNIEVARLDSHVRFFARRKYRFLLGRDFATSWPSRSVCFTFDDGFSGAVLDGLATLDRYGAKGTVYAVTDQVGTHSDWEGESPYPLATWDELRAAAARGHEIGNHTRTHARLGAVSVEEQRAQIEGARAALEREGLGGGSFCLPYGSYADSTLPLLRGAGVDVCMSTHKGLAQPENDRLLLPRVFVAYGDALPLLLYRVFIRQRLRRK